MYTVARRLGTSSERLMSKQMEFLSSDCFEPMARTPKLWKTHKGAQRVADRMDGVVVELDKKGCLIYIELEQ